MSNLQVPNDDDFVEVGFRIPKTMESEAAAKMASCQELVEGLCRCDEASIEELNRRGGEPYIKQMIEEGDYCSFAADTNTTELSMILERVVRAIDAYSIWKVGCSLLDEKDRIDVHLVCAKPGADVPDKVWKVPKQEPAILVLKGKSK